MQKGDTYKDWIDLYEPMKDILKVIYNIIFLLLLLVAFVALQKCITVDVDNGDKNTYYDPTEPEELGGIYSSRQHP